MCWHIECSTFTASSFRICNSSTGIPSLPLALFIVMLLRPTWLPIPGCLALDEWSRHCDYLRKPKFNPWFGKIPWRREWQPAPVLLPRKFHGQRSLVGYSPWGCKQLDMTDQPSTRVKVYKSPSGARNNRHGKKQTNWKVLQGRSWERRNMEE